MRDLAKPMHFSFKAVWSGLCLLFVCLIIQGCGVAMLSDESLAKQSKAQFNEMKKRETISSRSSYQELIREIGERIADVAQVDLPGTEWEFVVFQKGVPNAFAMPGGKVGVNSGLIDLANGNEDEIAAVMGHEIAHVAFRHSNKRMSQAMGIALGGVILDTAMRKKSSSTEGLPVVLMLQVPCWGWLSLLVVHRNAKLITGGLYYAAMAGYDPRGAISFWKKMNKTGKRTPEFLSTHPDPGNRIKFLEANMDKAYALYVDAKKARGETPNP